MEGMSRRGRGGEVIDRRGVRGLVIGEGGVIGESLFSWERG